MLIEKFSIFLTPSVFGASVGFQQMLWRYKAVFPWLLRNVDCYGRPYIFILWFLLLLSFFFFFPRLMSAVADWMSATLPHMVWP